MYSHSYHTHVHAFRSRSIDIHLRGADNAIYWINHRNTYMAKPFNVDTEIFCIQRGGTLYSPPVLLCAFLV